MGAKNDETNLDLLSSKELRELCRSKGICTKGVTQKADLVVRLQRTSEEPENFITCLVDACEKGDLETILRSLDRLSSRDLPDLALEEVVSAFDFQGDTLLHRCITGFVWCEERYSARDYATAICTLASAQADVNSANLRGETPLYAGVRQWTLTNEPDAVKQSSADSHSVCVVVQALLDCGANANLAIADTGRTPIIEAASVADVLLCHCLMESGADPSLTEIAGQSALDIAAKLGSRKLMQTLESSTADLCESLRSQGSQIEWDDVSAPDCDIPSDLEQAADIHGRVPLSDVVDVAIDCLDEEKQFGPCLQWIKCTPSSGTTAVGGLFEAFGPHSPWIRKKNDDTKPKPTHLGDEGSLEERCKVAGISHVVLGANAAEEVLADIANMKRLSIGELRNACATKALSIDGCVEKADILARLTRFRAWELMNEEALRLEFGRICGGNPDFAAMQGASRVDLIKNLAMATFGVDSSAPSSVRDQCEAKCIPFDLCDGADRARDLLEQVAILEKINVVGLKKMFSERGLILEPGSERQDLLAKLRDLTIWENLPRAGLQQICQQRGFPSTGSREDLLHRLVSSLVHSSSQSRFKHFFSFGRDPEQKQNHEENRPQYGSQANSDFPGARDPAFPPGHTERDPAFEAAWRSRAEENRRQFLAGNRNHAGMPTGQRRPGAAAPPGWKGKWKHKPDPSQFGPGGAKTGPSSVPVNAGACIGQHFRTLGLTRNVTEGDVRKVYRSLALRYHPDKNEGKNKQVAQTKFLQVNEAYEKVIEYFRGRENRG